MAVVLDTVTTTGDLGTANSFSFSHTTSGSNRYLGVIVYQTSSQQSVSSITYGGTGLSLIQAINISGSSRIEVWGLAGPALGSNTVSGSFGGFASSLRVSAISFTGAKQTGQPDTSNATTGQVQIGGSQQPSITLTTSSDGCMIFDAVLMFGNTGALTPGSGQTSRVSATEGTSWIGASTEPQASAGSVTMDWTNGSQLIQWGIIAVAVAPLATITQNNSVKANIKATTSQGNSSKGNMLRSYLQDNTAKANIKTTYYTGMAYDWTPSTVTTPHEGINRGYNS